MRSDTDENKIADRIRFRTGTPQSGRAQLSRRDIENAKADLSSAWKGESAQHFQKKTEILQEDIRGTAKELNAIAAAIREIAAKIYAAEMEALRIATQREYI